MQYVRDTVLYVMPKPDICHVHTFTRRKPRVTDGKRHPVKVTKVSAEEMEKLWK